MSDQVHIGIFVTGSSRDIRLKNTGNISFVTLLGKIVYIGIWIISCYDCYQSLWSSSGIILISFTKD